MSGRDLGASVRQRLLNQSRAQNRPFQELLQYFAMERFLYRLAKSPHADRFILKGALLLTAWRAPVSRPTMDIDLAGRTTNQLDHIQEVVSAVCGVAVTTDGIEFNRDSIEVSRVKEDADVILIDEAHHFRNPGFVGTGRGQFQPTADEGLHFGADAEKVLNNGLQTFRVSALLGQPPCKVELGPMRNIVVALQAVHADADETADELGPVLILRPIEIHRLLRIGPRAKEE